MTSTLPFDSLLLMSQLHAEIVREIGDMIAGIQLNLRSGFKIHTQHLHTLFEGVVTIEDL
jgi:hypothetical protein